MNRRQLIAAAARRSSLTQRQVRRALQAIVEVVAESLADGEPVVLPNFGRFDLQRYPGRTLRRFGEDGQYTVQERWVPVFRSAPALRRRVREKRS
jgi:integration host factor subunit beta